MNKLSLGLLAVTLVLMTAGVMFAASALTGANQGPDIQAFDELQGVRLPAPLPVDARGTSPPTDIRTQASPAGTLMMRGTLA